KTTSLRNPACRHQLNEAQKSRTLGPGSVLAYRRRRSVVGAEASVVLIADVEARVERIFNRLAIDELDHHVRSAIAHLERTLTDLCMAAAFTESLGLRRQRVTSDDEQVLGLQLFHDLVSDLCISLRSELCPAANENEGVQIRV